jgi:hypothetical protein
VVGTLDIEDERTDAFGPHDRQLFEGVATELVTLVANDPPQSSTMFWFSRNRLSGS